MELVKHKTCKGCVFHYKILNGCPEEPCPRPANFPFDRMPKDDLLPMKSTKPTFKRFRAREVYQT